ncbi:hypothetical protein [Bacillus bombysepticus]|uniref:hypothetical protein n=1 Tax=Bacillus bombysepticus TaxID=658666 RepID=UPI00301920E3
MGLFFGLLQLIVILGAMFAGLFYLQKWLKKAERHRRSDRGVIQIVDRMRLGMKDEVMLTKVGDEYLMYSTVSGAFTRLEQKDIKVIDEDFDEFFNNEGPNVFQSIKNKVNKKMVK